MKTGIITNGGKFIPCMPYSHIDTAQRHDISWNYFIVRPPQIVWLGEEYPSKLSLNYVFDLLTKEGLIFEDVVDIDIG